MPHLILSTNQNILINKFRFFFSSMFHNSVTDFLCLSSVVLIKSLLDKFNLFVKSLKTELDNLNNNNIRFTVIGDILAINNNIKEEILEPLQLNNTYGSLSEVNIDDVMSGYHVGHPHDLKTDEHGMLATAEDVGTFIRALNDGSVFEPGEQDIYSSIYEICLSYIKLMVN